jgi:alpha-methylacyl-CoA racemase
LLLVKLELDATDLPEQYDQSHWPAMRERFATIFRSKTRDEWCALLEGTDACFAPVLTFSEAREHPHHVARGAFVAGGPMPELVPSPRLSRTPGNPGTSPAWPGADTSEVLQEFGFDDNEVARLRDIGAIG